MKPKIIILHGSPRKYGSISKLVEIASRGILDAGGEYEVIYLYDHRIEPCYGCVSDDPKICKFPCIIRDDFNRIAGKILDSHGFILAAPLYWYSVPGHVKNFIDRLTSLENMIIHTGRSLLEGKVAGFIVSGNDSGSILSIAHLMVTLNSMGVHIPAWALAYHHTMEDVLEDEQAVSDSYNVGYIVTKMASEITAVKEWYKPLSGDKLEELKKYAIRQVEKSMNQKRERYKYYEKTMSPGEKYAK
jgi:multimeric flavodoxin WrbA